MSTIAQGIAALAGIQSLGFIGRNQSTFIRSLIRTCEEKDHYIDKMIEMEQRINSMPVTYQQDGLGDNAIAHLHYFCHGFDAYITEKDSTPGQNQAFGYVRHSHMPECAEMTYVSLPEILAHPDTEIDLHFTPTPIGRIKQRFNRAA